MTCDERHLSSLRRADGGVGVCVCQVCYVKRLSNFLSPQTLVSKGTDASNIHDEELPAEEQVGPGKRHHCVLGMPSPLHGPYLSTSTECTMHFTSCCEAA